MASVLVQAVNESIQVVEALDSSVTVEVLTPLPTEVVEVWVPGLPGPKGEDGVAGGTVVEFTQDLASNHWVIPHPFTKEPTVKVFDSSGEAVGVEIVYSDFLVEITPDLAFSGRAILSG